MARNRYKQHPAGLRVMQRVACLGLYSLLTLLFAAGLAVAQKSASCNGCPALDAAKTSILPRFPDERVVGDNGRSPNNTGEQKRCVIQPFPGLASVTSVDNLELPPKAQKEYGAACSALKSNQLAASERHLRRALQIYPKYVAGWVMLGQILEAEQQTEQARSACSRAADTDPNYLGSLLCLAEIAGREEKWDEVLRYASRALEVDSPHDPYAYFFSAIAYFNLDDLAEAEQRALRAEQLDSEHREPRVPFLLGQIYKAKNDSVHAAAQLREYLKYAPNATDSEIVKKELAELETGNYK